MDKRPKIELQLNQTDKTLELIGWFAVFGIWVLTVANYSELSDIIATHYNGT